jgi:hypothetical protein
MNRRNLFLTAFLAVPLAVAGVVYANSQMRGYTCPLTGEHLPCEKCCPLNQKKETATEGYTCPITGEQLACPKCCPLNQGNK